MSAKLRVGALLPSLSTPEWIHRLLTAIANGPDSTMEMVVVTQGSKGESISDSWNTEKGWVWSLYRKLDRVAWDPLAATSAETVLRDVEKMMLSAPGRVSPEDVSAIKARNLDVLLDLAPFPVKGELHGLAEHGVWRHQLGAAAGARDIAPGAWESLIGSAVTQGVLLRMDQSPERWVAAGTFPTIDYSAGINCALFLERVIDLTVSTLHRLRVIGPEGISNVPIDTRPQLEASTASPSPVEPPSNTTILGLWGRQAFRRVLSHIRNRLVRGEWFLLYSDIPDGDGANPINLNPSRMQRILPPPDRYWADPFPTRRDGRSYVLFEEVPYATRLGHICALELGPNGPVSLPACILKREHHLSYPFLLSWEGEDYLIPESMEAGRVEYYRSTNYPWQWEYGGVLLEQRVADASIVRINDRWWMFASGDDGYGAQSELLLFHSVSPLGPWLPHAKNPVKRDVRGARPAGRPFRRHGRWYRSGQDSSKHYGRALVLFEILQLDEWQYEERELRTIEPTWSSDVVSIHTLNEDQGLIVADAERLRWAPLWGK